MTDDEKMKKSREMGGILASWMQEGLAEAWWYGHRSACTNCNCPETINPYSTAYVNPDDCGQCYACIGDKPAYEGTWLTVGMTRMIVCATCGNKRCPHSTDHRFTCTGSNEPGQEGSRYA